MNYKAQLARLDIKITTGMEHTYCTFALCSESPRETVLQSISQANRKGVGKVIDLRASIYGKGHQNRGIVSDVLSDVERRVLTGHYC